MWEDKAFKRTSQVIWLSLACHIMMDMDLNPMLRRKLGLLSKQLHPREEETEWKKVIRDQRYQRFWGTSTFWHHRIHANGSRTQRMRDNKGTTSVLLWMCILNICWRNSSCPATRCQWPTASGRSIKRSSGPEYNSNVACLPSLPVRCVYNSIDKSLYSMSPTLVSSLNYWASCIFT